MKKPKKKNARHARRSSGAAVQTQPARDDLPSFSEEDVAKLAVDVWKMGRRALGENAQRTVTAYERAEERFKKLGIDIVDLTGRAYDTDMRVKVLDKDGALEPYSVGQCLSPAVYHNGVLIIEAEVVIFGAEVNGKNS